MRTLLLSLLVLNACATPAATTVPGELKGTGEVVLTVDGTPITQDMLDALTARIPAKQLEMMKASGQYKQFVEQMGVAQVLYKQAVEKKLYEDPTVQLRLAMGARDLLANEVVTKIGDEAVTDDKIKAAYEERKAQYARPQVKVRHILFKDAAEAAATLELLKGGADFEAVAKEKSADKGSGARGGDLGWLAEGAMVKEVTDAAFAAQPNELIGPVESRMGFHLVQVTDKRDAIPLDEVKDQLTNTVKQEAVRAFIDSTKTSLKIEWKQEPPAGEAPAGGPPGMPMLKPQVVPAKPAAPAAPPAPAAPAAPAHP